MQAISGIVAATVERIHVCRGIIDQAMNLADKNGGFMDHNAQAQLDGDVAQRKNTMILDAKNQMRAALIQYFDIQIQNLGRELFYMNIFWPLYCGNTVTDRNNLLVFVSDIEEGNDTLNMTGIPFATTQVQNKILKFHFPALHYF